MSKSGTVDVDCGIENEQAESSFPYVWKYASRDLCGAFLIAAAVSFLSFLIVRDQPTFSLSLDMLDTTVTTHCSWLRANYFISVPASRAGCHIIRLVNNHQQRRKVMLCARYPG